MKRKKFVLIIDLCTCLLLIAMAWFCLYKGLYNFYNEYLEITAVEFLGATYSIIASVVYILYIIPVDIKQIKERKGLKHQKKKWVYQKVGETTQIMVNIYPKKQNKK